MKLLKGLAAGLGLAVVCLAPVSARAQTTLTLGGSDAIGSLLDRQNALFTKLVNERAAGKLKINFIQGEQLGNDQQVIEQMIAGSVHIYGDVLDWYANWVKDFAIMGWGFTFRDTDHLQKFTESAAYQKLAEELRSIPGATYTLVDAEGDEIEQEAIVGYMRFHGLERHVDVHIMDGPFPDILLGLEVLKGYQVCMEIVDNGQITIELISS